MNEDIKQDDVIEDKSAEETAEDLKVRLENAKAENARKAQEIQRLREEMDAKRTKASDVVFNPQDLTTWKDHELKAVMKDPQYAALHDQASELLERRRFHRFQAEKDESQLRMNTELERQKEYPETFDPANPMAVRMSELMNQYHLANNPAGRLLAARLAHSEVKTAKARAVGRKEEQDRQVDVKASFQGDAVRPAPKVSDKVKVEELKKRAMSGDREAQAEWFKHKGLI